VLFSVIFVFSVAAASANDFTATKRFALSSVLLPEAVRCLLAGDRAPLGKTYSRNPSVVVDNMAGAGSLIAANYLYKIAEAGRADDRQLSR
jgi:hypothetical protein